MLTQQITEEVVFKILKKYIDEEIKAEDIDEYVFISGKFEQEAFKEAVKKYGVLQCDYDSRLLLCQEDENGDIVVTEYDEDEENEDLDGRDNYQIKWYRLYYDMWDERYYVEFSDY